MTTPPEKLTAKSARNRLHWAQVDLANAHERIRELQQPIPMLLKCPECNTRHIDVSEFATKPHHTHACQQCGHVWRPALVATVGVQFLPGFKNE